MILLLIYILFKQKSNKYGTDSGLLKFIKTHTQVLILSFLIILLSPLPFISKTQNLQLNYKILQGGDDIGWLRLEKNITGTKLNLVLISEIKARFFFQINVKAKETSIYENGKMIYSSQFRKTNGTTKLDKQTWFIADKYEVQENGERERLSFPYISANLLSLYFQEPIGINQVYCDNHKCFTGITKMDDGGYKVKFPDGNSNSFYYKDGFCNKIRISHTFYSAQIILTSAKQLL